LKFTTLISTTYFNSHFQDINPNIKKSQVTQLHVHYVVDLCLRPYTSYTELWVCGLRCFTWVTTSARISSKKCALFTACPRVQQTHLPPVNSRHSSWQHESEQTSSHVRDLLYVPATSGSAENLCKFYVLLTVHLDNLCNENQLDALFILNLLRQSTSACFGGNYCPSSGGTHCICAAVCTCYTF
jgi:hypothetical protein